MIGGDTGGKWQGNERLLRGFEGSWRVLSGGDSVGSLGGLINE